MKSEDLKKLVRKQVTEILNEATSKYTTIDQVLDALMHGDITKLQAKRFIKKINDGEIESSSRKSSYSNDVGCSYGSSQTSYTRC